MNSIELFRATLDGRPTERTPVITQVFGYAAVAAGIELPLYYQGGAALADAQLHTLRRFGADAVFTFVDGCVETEAMGGEVEFPADSYPYLTTPLFQSTFDPEQIRLPDPYVDGRMPGLLKATRLLNQTIGNTTMIVGIACGPLTLVSQWLGLEAALICAIEDAARFQAFLDRAEAVCRTWGLAQLKAGAHLIYAFDPVASPSVVPANFFREFEHPALHRILDAWQTAGNYCRSLHITGPIEPLLPFYKVSGVELANFDYEVDLLRLAPEYPDLVINGNIRPLLLQESDPEPLLASCQEVLSAMAPRGKFILSPGCEAPLQTRCDTLLAFCSSVHTSPKISKEKTGSHRLTLTRSDKKTPLLEQASVAYGEPLVDALRRLGHPILLGCAGIGSCGRCEVRVREGRSPAPSSADSIHFSEEQLLSGSRLACQTYLHDSLLVEFPETTLESRWQLLPEQRIPVFTPGAEDTLVDRDQSSASLLLDLGTSRLELSSIKPDGTLDRIVAHANPQGNFGTDIIARAQAATTHPRALKDMRQNLAAALHKGCLEFDIDPLDAARPFSLTIAGNTVMLCLFAGNGFESTLTPENWTRPILPELRDEDPFWKDALPAAGIDLIAPVGGFVGSDLVAGLIAARLTEGSDPALFVDFGTNSEVALWSGSQLWIASAAGGPAFEGCGLSNVIPAGPGAIRNCRVGASGHLDAVTIDNKAPIGFCTTGMIDVVSAFLRRGWIDERGNIVHSPNLNLPFPWHLQKPDLDYLQRAKAGIGATIDLLLDRAKIPPSALRRVCLAGQVGEFINPESARALGIVPFVALEHVESLSHAPLRGAALWALSDTIRSRACRMASRSILISPALEDQFEDRFIEHLYLRPMHQPGNSLT